MSGGGGVLTVVVWPPYVGLSTADPGAGPVAVGEPFQDLNYTRGLITWRTELDGNIVGGATVYLPKGIYTHVLFFRGPHQPALMGSKRLEQPVVFDRPGMIEIDPIQNQDYLPRRA